MQSATTSATDTPARFHPASSADFVPREQLRGLQSQRLRQVISRVCEHVPLYRQRMEKRGLTPAEIRGVEDIHKLPFTVKDDLRDTYPLSMLTVPIEQVSRLHAPSGATGKRIMVAYTAHDLEVWTELLVRSLVSCGIDGGDTIQNACGSSLFNNGLGVQNSVERLGATVIPVAGGDTDHQIAVMKDFGVSAICCTPRYLLHLAERGEEIGVDLRELPLRVGALFAGPWSEAMRRRIEESAGIKAFAVYNSSEVIGAGLGAECPWQDGLHVFEDHFFPEIVDPDSGDPLPDGEEGELVLTTLSREALPVIRFRTGDITTIIPEPCPCGRTIRRIRSSSRRTDDMLVIDGVNVFPSEIEAALLAVEGTLPHYQIVLTQEEGRDQVEVQIEVTSQIFSDRVSAMENLQSRVVQEIQDSVGVRTKVRLVEPHTIRGSQSNVRRVVDQRGD